MRVVAAITGGAAVSAIAGCVVAATFFFGEVEYLFSLPLGIL